MKKVEKLVKTSGEANILLKLNMINKLSFNEDNFTAKVRYEFCLNTNEVYHLFEIMNYKYK